MIAASFGLPGLWRVFLANRKAKRLWGLASAKLTVDGRVVPDRYAAAIDWTKLGRDPWRWVCELRRGEAASRIRVYHLGTFIEEFEQPLAMDVQVEAAITSPDLTLSISQSSVVRNPHFAEGLARLRSSAALASQG